MLPVPGGRRGDSQFRIRRGRKFPTGQGSRRGRFEAGIASQQVIPVDGGPLFTAQDPDADHRDDDQRGQASESPENREPVYPGTPPGGVVRHEGGHRTADFAPLRAPHPAGLDVLPVFPGFLDGRGLLFLFHRGGGMGDPLLFEPENHVHDADLVPRGQFLFPDSLPVEDRPVHAPLVEERGDPAGQDDFAMFAGNVLILYRNGAFRRAAHHIGAFLELDRPLFIQGLNDEFGHAKVSPSA